MKSTWKRFSSAQASIGLLPWQGWQWQSSRNNHVWKPHQAALASSQWRLLSLLLPAKGHSELSLMNQLMLHWGFTRCTCKSVATLVQTPVSLHWLINTGWTRLRLGKRSRKDTRLDQKVRITEEIPCYTAQCAGGSDAFSPCRQPGSSRVSVSSLLALHLFRL